MTLQTTASSANPLQMTEISTEFGGASPYKLTNYYKGGGNVAAHGNNSTIPTSGRINILNFLGCSRNFETTITYASGAYSSATQTLIGQSKSSTTQITMNSVVEVSLLGSFLLQLYVVGDKRISVVGTWFDSITFGGFARNRNATSTDGGPASVPDGSYNSGSNLTQWQWGKNTPGWGVIGFTGTKNMILSLDAVV